MNAPGGTHRCNCALCPIVETVENTSGVTLFYDLAFFVPGPARAKQSFRYGRNGHSFQSARVKGWQADVGWAAQQAMRIDVNHLEKFPLHGKLAVELIFFLKQIFFLQQLNLRKCLVFSVQQQNPIKTRSRLSIYFS